jgi:pSer/pThr/pTyr-binding forkhead associated (FHA) protein
MDNLGTLLVADTGSTNGTHINGQRIAYGEAHPINEGDLVSFGDVEVRFRKIAS